MAGWQTSFQLLVLRGALEPWDALEPWGALGPWGAMEPWQEPWQPFFNLWQLNLEGGMSLWYPATVPCAWNKDLNHTTTNILTKYKKDNHRTTWIEHNRAKQAKQRWIGPIHLKNWQFFNFCLVYDLMALCEPEPDHVLGWPDLENPSSPIWRKKPPSPQDQGSNRGWEWIWIGFGSSWFEFLFFKNMSHLYLFCNHIFICIFIYVSHLETWAHCARFHLGEILSCRSEVDNGRSRGNLIRGSW